MFYNVRDFEEMKYKCGRKGKLQQVWVIRPHLMFDVWSLFENMQYEQHIFYIDLDNQNLQCNYHAKNLDVFCTLWGAAVSRQGSLDWRPSAAGIMSIYHPAADLDSTANYDYF